MSSHRLTSGGGCKLRTRRRVACALTASSGQRPASAHLCVQTNRRSVSSARPFANFALSPTSACWRLRPKRSWKRVPISKLLTSGALLIVGGMDCCGACKLAWSSHHLGTRRSSVDASVLNPESILCLILCTAARSCSSCRLRAAPVPSLQLARSCFIAARSGLPRPSGQLTLRST